MAIRKGVIKGQLQHLNELRKRILFQGATFQHPTQVLRSETLDAVFTSELLDATHTHRAETLFDLDLIIKILTDELERQQ